MLISESTKQDYIREYGKIELPHDTVALTKELCMYIIGQEIKPNDRAALNMFTVAKMVLNQIEKRT